MNQNSFNSTNFYNYCDLLYKRDKDLKEVNANHGHPPMWTRPPDFQTLILIILEQQVSLASAYAAFKKLKQRIGRVTPARIMELTDKDLRACYFSRQKTIYAKELANAVLSGQLSLKKLINENDESIRTTLKKIKGIGDWTVDIFLIHSLQRLDIFPLGDLALVNSMKEVKKLSPGIKREELIEISKNWQPYRTIATMILWHAYIKKRNIRIHD